MKRALIVLLLLTPVFGASKLAKDTIHFVGGSGTLAGDALPGGGCTSATYSGDPTDYFGTNGAALIDMTAVAYTHATKNFNKTGIGVGVLVGTLAYITGTNITDGVYEVTTVTDDDNIICADITSADNTADATVTIGGAYDALQTAFDDDATACEGPSSEFYNRYICTNKDETVSASVTPLGGDRASGKFIYVIGFNTALYLPNGDGVAQATSVDTGIISDMDKESFAGPHAGQFTTSYYGGALEAIRYVENGAYYYRPNSDWISIDADDNAIDVWTVGGDNIEVRNLKLHNTDLTTDGSDCVTASAAREGSTFINCWFDDTDDLIDGGNLDESVFLDCYFGKTLGSPGYASYAGMTSTLYYGCVFNSTGTYCVTALEDSTMINCLVYGGDYGVYAGIGAESILNCVVYKNTIASCLIAGDTRSFTCMNSIFSPAASNDKALTVSAGGGTYIGSNNCAYSVIVGAPLTTPFFNNNAATNSEFYLPGTIEADPQFVDAANFDFRIKRGSPCEGMGVSSFDPPAGGSIGLDGSDRNRAKSGLRSRYDY